MDEFDRASEIEERDRMHARTIRKKSLTAVGACYNCGEDCVGCFCGPDCSADYERRETARERNGNVT